MELGLSGRAHTINAILFITPGSSPSQTEKHAVVYSSQKSNEVVKI